MDESTDVRTVVSRAVRWVASTAVLTVVLKAAMMAVDWVWTMDTMAATTVEPMAVYWAH